MWELSEYSNSSQVVFGHKTKEQVLFFEVFGRKLRLYSAKPGKSGALLSEVEAAAAFASLSDEQRAMCIAASIAAGGRDA